jgi:hypothetical protein
VEVSGQLHYPVALPPRKESPVPTGEWVGSRGGLDAVAKDKVPSPCRESKPGRPVRSLVAILTELFQCVNYNGGGSLR